MLQVCTVAITGVKLVKCWTLGGEREASSRIYIYATYALSSSCASAECMNIAHAQSPGHSIYVYTHELRT